MTRPIGSLPGARRMLERAIGDAEAGDRHSSATWDVGETAGQKAERLVHDRLRAALPESVSVLPNVRWRERDHGDYRDGEADLVIADPDRGFLVIEVKAGEIRRDGRTWWAGGERLRDRRSSRRPTPATRWCASCASCPRGTRRSTRSPATRSPSPTSTSRAPGHASGMLGPDVDPDLILDQHRLLDGDDPESRPRARGCLATLEGFGRDSSARGHPAQGHRDPRRPARRSPSSSARMLRYEIVAGEREVVRLTDGPVRTSCNTLRGQRRAAIVGGAGTGKTMLAVEKARRLAREGYRTLLVCFNSPLARDARATTTRRDRGADRAARRPDLPPAVRGPRSRGGDAAAEAVDPVPPDLVRRPTLPGRARRGDRRARAAVPRDRRRRGPGLRRRVARLARRAAARRPARTSSTSSTIRRSRSTATTRCRVAWPPRVPTRPQLPQRPADPRPGRAVSPTAGSRPSPCARTGVQPELIEADGDAATLEALRRVLHRLRADEGVRPGEIAVLTGLGRWRTPPSGSSGASATRCSGTAATTTTAARSAWPPTSCRSPRRTSILCDSIRRFKGLERPVIVLVELRPTTSGSTSCSTSVRLGRDSILW